MVFTGGNQPRGESPIERWRREWRRNGGGLMGATFLVGGTWVTSSQTFVATHDGQLVHPSPYGWLFWVCVVGMAFGFYVWLSTYVDRLPMLGKRGAVGAGRWWSMQTSRTPFPAPMQVEIVRHGMDRPIPFLAPEAYQVHQLRQALAKLREVPFETYGLMDIEMMLRKLNRSDTDPVYEPLHVSPTCTGIVALLASGELVQAEQRRYRLPDSVAENSGAGSESS